MTPDQSAHGDLEFLQQYESDVVLRDGTTLHLRPVRAEDRPRLLEFYRKLSSESLYYRFEPKVVAVVGASRTRGKIGAEIFHNLRATPFQGTVVPVNPDATPIDGVTAYARVSTIPFDVDLAVLVVPAAQVLEVVDDCVGKGVKALVIISAGQSGDLHVRVGGQQGRRVWQRSHPVLGRGSTHVGDPAVSRELRVSEEIR